MSNIIFYFSGTGNSLTVARDIAEKLGDTEVVSIASVLNADIPDLNFERVGFVFPLYFASLPPIVRRFVAKLSFNKTQYVFGIVTFGGTSGMALAQLSQCITERGGILNAGFGVRMPGNYIVKYGAYPDGIRRMIIKIGKKKVSSIAAMVSEKKVLKIPKGDLSSRLSTGAIDKFMQDFSTMSKDFRVTEKCSGCRTCERICPVGNIKMADNKPVWGDKCERCVACIQWCPSQAIEYAEKTVGRKRYRNPEIKARDLMRA